MHTLSQKIEFIEKIFGKGTLGGRGVNFDVRCPICAPSDHSKKKLSIRLDDDRLHCWVCGFKSRSLGPLIKKFGSASHLQEYKEVFGRGDSGTYHDPDREPEQKIELPVDFKLLTDGDEGSPDVKAAWRYVASRGLTERDVLRYRLGTSQDFRWKRRVIMPSFDSTGAVNFFTGRAIDKERRPKYDNPDVDKNPIVFNDVDLDWSSRMVVVEGPFDLVKCPDNSVPILGSDLDERHEVFNRIIINSTPVVLALDGDMWNGKTRKIAQRLMSYDVEVRLADVRAWGDPGRMTRAQVEEAVNAAQVPTWEDDFSCRMTRAFERQRFVI